MKKIDIPETINLTRTLDQASSAKERFRIYRELWNKAGRYQVLTDFPMHLDIELSGKCNLKCEFCFQNNLIRSHLGFMAPELYKNIITEGVQHGLCAVKLQIRGESLLHPDFFGLVAFAKAKGVMDVQVTTNGTLLDDQAIEQIFNSGLDALILSVDAHHETTYLQRKQAHTYSSVESAVTKLLARRKELGRSRPWIRLRASIPAHDAGALHRTRAYLKEKFPLADIIVVGRIHNFKDNEDSYPDLTTAYTFSPCAYLTQRLAIYWDGAVTTCCMDYNSKFNLGNANSDAIQDIWLSRQMNRFRSRHLIGDRGNMPICRHCHACVTLKSTEGMMDTTPKHIADYNEVSDQ